jgi:RNA polymerase sigma-70 factor, ECF subfamily
VQDELENMAIQCAKQAWTQLFAWHFDAVYAFCVQLTGGNRDQAEEVTQVAFVTAARVINRYQAKKGSFRTWMLGMARHHLMKVQRSEKRRRGREQIHDRTRLPAQESSQKLVVYDVLACLSLRHRCALEDKYIHGHSLKHMAQTYEISEAATESLLRRARAKFAQVHRQTESSSHI